MALAFKNLNWVVEPELKPNIVFKNIKQNKRTTTYVFGVCVF